MIKAKGKIGGLELYLSYKTLETGSLSLTEYSDYNFSMQHLSVHVQKLLLKQIYL